MGGIDWKNITFTPWFRQREATCVCKEGPEIYSSADPIICSDLLVKK